MARIRQSMANIRQSRESWGLQVSPTKDGARGPLRARPPGDVWWCAPQPEHIRQSMADSGTYKTVKARFWHI